MLLVDRIRLSHLAEETLGDAALAAMTALVVSSVQRVCRWRGLRLLGCPGWA